MFVHSTLVPLRDYVIKGVHHKPSHLGVPQIDHLDLLRSSRRLDSGSIRAVLISFDGRCELLGLNQPWGMQVLIKHDFPQWVLLSYRLHLGRCVLYLVLVGSPVDQLVILVVDVLEVS